MIFTKRKADIMEKREMKNLGISTSLLGFGCMRFPTLENGKIDPELSDKMLELAIEQGVNYFDTAYVYHGGESESYIGNFLEKYDRSSYYIATKLPLWEVHSLDDAKRLFAEQLKRLNKDYVDFYLLHAINLNAWERMLECGVVDYFEELKKQGKIKHFGFSFHDEYSTFETVMNYKKWDFCQIQLNYMDTDEQAGIKGCELAEKLGVPVIVMEPIKGGSLANLPDDITGEFMQLQPFRSIASWAMRWVASLSGVKVILSGMSTIGQVHDNLSTCNDFMPLSENEQQAVINVIQKLKERVKNNCTGCNYCMPCPAGVNIPYNFNIWNGYGKYGIHGQSKWQWEHDINDKQKAHNCISCGKCEEVCPQKISIIENLATLEKELNSLSK